MKKSQILAALALAFALGVVAPVAGVMNSTETYAVEARAAETASKQEVLEAASKIENYGPYKTFKALIDTVNKYSTEKLSDGTTALNSASPASLVSAIASKVDTINNNTGTATTYVDLESALAAAGRVDKYNAYNTLYTLLSKKNNELDASTLRSAMLGVDNSNAVQNDTLNMTVAELRNYVNTNTAFAKYSSYVDLFKAVADANAYNGIVDAFEIALNNAQEWTKNDDGETAVDIALGKTNPAKELNTLATTKVDGYTEYSALVAAVKNAKDTVDANGETTKNRGLINTLNADLEAASSVIPGKKVSLKDLPAADSGNQGDGTNKPGDDNKDDQKAPTTGILSDGEGSASTTVAMVAGVATALTAAGAGVVAYRNARRSSRK